MKTMRELEKEIHENAVAHGWWEDAEHRAWK